MPADKTKNHLGKEWYKKLLWKSITKHYRAAEDHAYDEINEEAQITASKLGIADRIDTMAKREAFITLKDHKDNFDNSLSCSLINPAKSEMGRVSKRILDNINGKLKGKLEVMLWKNSAAVIEWF